MLWNTAGDQIQNGAKMDSFDAMSDLDPLAEAGIREIEAQIAESQRRADKAVQLRDEIDAMSDSVTSSGREVTIDVDSLGRLRNITFADSAYHLDPARLAEVVLETYRQAHQAIGTAIMHKIEDAYGAESATTEAMRQTFMPPPPPVDDEPKNTPPRPGQGPFVLRRR